MGLVGIGFEQDAGVEQLSSMSLTFAEESFEMLPLGLGKADDVLLRYEDFRRSSSMPGRIRARTSLFNQTVTED